MPSLCGAQDQTRGPYMRGKLSAICATSPGPSLNAHHQLPPCIALDSWGHMTLFILLRDGLQCHELSYGAMRKKDPLAFTQSSDWIPEAPLF